MRTFVPQDFGARADGVAKDTAAIQAAIDEAAKYAAAHPAPAAAFAASGAAAESRPAPAVACFVPGTAVPGSRVTLPPGTYLSGALRLRPGVELHLEKGARLLASPDMADFPDWPDARHVVAANCPRGRNAAFLFADECDGVAITGEGTIDGNGRAHVRRKTAPDWTGWEFERIRPAGESLPRVVFLAGCRDVRIEGVSLVNGPAGWGFWIHDCDRVCVRGLTIRSDVRYPNNDGLHVNCSRDVDVTDCDIECGDDAIVVRANSRSLAENKPCERVHVRDCRVRSWASGIRVGWCCDGTIRDCTFRRIAMRDTTNGIDIVLPPMPDNPDYGREATLIENLLFEDIAMDGIYAHPLDAKIEGDPQTTRVEAVRRVTLRRVRATALELPNVCGRPDAPFRDFRFEDCEFRRVGDAELPGWERHGAANIGRTRPARYEHAEGFSFAGGSGPFNAAPPRTS